MCGPGPKICPPEQRFRGELQLLDEAPKKAEAASRGSRRPAFSGGADPLDDDIPFKVFLPSLIVENGDRGLWSH
jgi:hypothetical protein